MFHSVNAAAPRARRFALAAIVVLAAATAGCAGFGKLRSNDAAVTEEEVLAAGDPKSDPALLEHLHYILDHRATYDTGIVVAALVAVGQRRDPSSIQPISRLCGDDSEEVRWHCVRALKAIGGPEATAALAQFANDKSVDVRDEAAAR